MIRWIVIFVVFTIIGAISVGGAVSAVVYGGTATAAGYIIQQTWRSVSDGEPT